MAGGKIHFTKMHGCGNDYIYFNCFEDPISNPEELAVRLSDRHKGIGGDGVILICPSDIADAKMRMFNLDGSEGMMCGNGVRCVAKFVYDRGIATKEVLKIETLSGIKTCHIHHRGGVCHTVTVDMGQAVLEPERIPVRLPGDKAIAKKVQIDGKEYEISCVSMGNPHCVTFGEDPRKLDIEAIGPLFENHPIFPERVNTEFIQVIDSHTLRMRVWERGSGETMACGTGACAAVVAAVHCGYCAMGEDILVHLSGGDLVIKYTQEQVLMTGEAVEVFQGCMEL